MRVGFALPQHGDATRPDGLILIARRAEALGFDSLWTRHAAPCRVSVLAMQRALTADLTCR